MEFLNTYHIVQILPWCPILRISLTEYQFCNRERKNMVRVYWSFFEGPRPNRLYDPPDRPLALCWGLQDSRNDFSLWCQKRRYTWREELGKFFWVTELLNMFFFFLLTASPPPPPSFPPLTRSHRTWLCLSFPSLSRGYWYLLCLHLMIILGNHVNVSYKLWCFRKMRHC